MIFHFDIAIQFEQGTKKWGCEIFTTENYYSEFGTNKSTAFLKSFLQLIETMDITDFDQMEYEDANRDVYYCPLCLAMFEEECICD